MTTLAPSPAPSTTGTPFLGTARLTGLLYLALGVTGIVGFLLIRPLLFDPDDPAASVANLIDHELLARVGIAIDLALVAAQALAALWFYKLFRSVDAFAAGAIAVFGMVNAVAILSSTAFVATALDSALADPAGRVGEPQLMYLVSENMWGVSTVFFGLWLVPMGWCVLRSARMPRLLGWVLMVGGVGYVLSAFTGYLLPDAGCVAAALVVPATIGEFWMIGYLLVKGDKGMAAGERSRLVRNSE